MPSPKNSCSPPFAPLLGPLEGGRSSLMIYTPSFGCILWCRPYVSRLGQRAGPSLIAQGIDVRLYVPISIFGAGRTLCHHRRLVSGQPSARLPSVGADRQSKLSLMREGSEWLDKHLAHCCPRAIDNIPAAWSTHVIRRARPSTLLRALW